MKNQIEHNDNIDLLTLTWLLLIPQWFLEKFKKFVPSTEVLCDNFADISLYYFEFDEYYFILDRILVGMKGLHKTSKKKFLIRKMIPLALVKVPNKEFLNYVYYLEETYNINTLVIPEKYLNIPLIKWGKCNNPHYYLLAFL